MFKTESQCQLFFYPWLCYSSDFLMVFLEWNHIFKLEYEIQKPKMSDIFSHKYVRTMSKWKDSLLVGDHCGSSREGKKDEGSSVDLCINSPCSSLAGHSAEHQAILGRGCRSLNGRLQHREAAFQGLGPGRWTSTKPHQFLWIRETH